MILEIMVEVASGVRSKVTFIDQGMLEDELEEALNKKVDIIFDSSNIDEYFKNQIMEDMIKLW